MLRTVVNRYDAAREEAAPFRDVVKIVITFWQILASYADVQIKWPQELLSLMKLLGALKIDIQVPNVACMLRNWTLHHYLVLYSVGPVLLLALLAVPVAVTRLVKSIPTSLRDDLHGHFWRSVVFVLYLIYPITSQYVISSFICDTVFEELDDPPYFDEKRFLHFDYRIDCDTDTHAHFLVLAWLFFFMWPIGVPLFLICLLNWYNVPSIAAQKYTAALRARFLEYCIVLELQHGGEALGGINGNIPLTSLSTAQLRELERVSDGAESLCDPSAQTDAVQAVIDKTIEIVKQEGDGVRQTGDGVHYEEQEATLPPTSPPHISGGIVSEAAQLGGAPTTERTSDELICILTDRASLMEKNGVIALSALCWDSNSENAKEALAVDRLGLLICAYEVQPFKLHMTCVHACAHTCTYRCSTIGSKSLKWVGSWC